MNGQSQQHIDFTIDKNNLYHEESITDLKVGSIRCLVPVNLDGTHDESRETLYIGNSQLMSPQGMVPIQAPLEVKSLEAAIDKFPEAMKTALEEMLEQARKMQQEYQQKQSDSDSRIYVPGR